MLKTLMSKVACLLAVVFLFQPALSVFATVVEPSTTSSEITTVTNADPNTGESDHLTISQSATLKSATEVEVTLVIEQKANENETLTNFLLKQTLNPAFTLNSDSVKISESVSKEEISTLSAEAQAEVEAFDVHEATIDIHEVDVEVVETALTFETLNSMETLSLYQQAVTGNNLVLGGKVEVGKVYVITYTVQLQKTVETGEVTLVKPATLDYQTTTSTQKIQPLDLEVISPVVTLAFPTVEQQPVPEVSVPEIVEPEVEATPEAEAPTLSPDMSQAAFAAVAPLATTSSVVAGTPTIVPNGDGTYKVTYQMTGNPYISKNPVDILFVIDQSTSMGSHYGNSGANSTSLYLAVAKKAVADFVDTFSGSGIDVKFASIGFGEIKGNATGGIISDSTQEWTNDAGTLKTKVGNYSVQGNGNQDKTNLTAALTQAKTMLSANGSRNDAQKIVIVLTDGDSNQGTDAEITTATTALKAVTSVSNGVTLPIKTFAVGLRPSGDNNTTIKTRLFGITNQSANADEYRTNYWLTTATINTTGEAEANTRLAEIFALIKPKTNPTNNTNPNVATNAKLNFELDVNKFMYVSTNDETEAKAVKAVVPHTVATTWTFNVEPKTGVPPGTYPIMIAQTKINYTALDNTSGSLDVGALTITVPDPQDLTLNKTMTQNKITLTLNGKGTSTTPIAADIVIILDKSLSMSGDANNATNGQSPNRKIDKLVTSAKAFVTTMLTGTVDIKMSLVNFDNTASKVDFDTSSTTRNWSSSSSEIQNQITNTLGTYTNTHDAFKKAQDLLATARTGAQKYVILFTDGLPTIYCTTANNGGTSNGVGTTCPYTSSGTGTSTQQARDAATAQYAELLRLYPNTAMYAIGLFTGAADQTAQNLLYNLQNQERTNQNTYLSKYYTSDPATLNTIFTTLANSIKSSLSDDIAKNTIVRDIVSPYFTLAPTLNVQYTDHANNPVTLTQYNETGIPPSGQYKIEDVTCNMETATTTNPKMCKQITFNIGTIKAPGVKITFDIVQREGVYGDNLPTNVKADVTYKYPVGNTEKTLLFPVPTTTLPRATVDVTLDLAKTATTNADESFTIELTLSGAITIQQSTAARVVIAIDNSSGNSNFAAMKNAATQLLAKLKAQDTSNKIQVQFVTFNETAQAAGSYQEIQSAAIPSMELATGTNSTNRNMAKAYELGASLLATNTPATQRYLIVLSSGAASDNATLVQNTYNGVFAQNPMLLTKVHTLAYLAAGTTPANANTVATNFPLLQNAVKAVDYAETYYPGNSVETEALLKDSVKFTRALVEETSTLMLVRIYNVISYNARIEDIVDERFQIVSGSAVVTGVSGKKDVTYTAGTTDKISVELGAVPQYTGTGTTPNNVKLSFKVKPRDSYYGTLTAIPTNVSATMTGTNPITNDPLTRDALSPTVTVPFKTGTLTVIKEIEGNVATGQAFDITLKGGASNEQYNFSVNQTTNKTMNFYMKASTTDISPNTDVSKGYLTVGTYNISELVPQNYQNVTTQYCYATINATTCDGTWQTGAAVIVDKDHQNVFVKVTNKLVNTNYWYDRSDVANTFTYTNTATQPPVLLSIREDDEDLVA